MKRILQYFKNKKEKRLEKKRTVSQKSENTTKPKNSVTPNNSPRDVIPKVSFYKREEKKQGILIGLNYPGSHYALNGCINDVKNGNEFLKAKGYETRFLEDKDISDEYNVLEALEELKDSPAQTVFFHYSGHGTQVPDLDGDEEDGLDEAVYSKNGQIITDDQIAEVLMTFPKGKTLFLIFDCCHSGTIADLPYIVSKTGIKLEKTQKIMVADIICLSGCEDRQTSADVTEKGVSYGALSATLYNILKNMGNKRITWGQLYKQLVLEMSFRGYSQYPQLTSSDPSILDKIVQF